MRGALPPVLLRAVCLVRAMVVVVAAVVVAVVVVVVVVVAVVPVELGKATRIRFVFHDTVTMAARTQEVGGG